MWGYGYRGPRNWGLGGLAVKAVEWMRVGPDLPRRMEESDP